MVAALEVCYINSSLLNTVVSFVLSFSNPPLGHGLVKSADFKFSAILHLESNLKINLSSHNF